MMLTITLYISLAIFIIGVLYKLVRWLSLTTTLQAKDMSASKRASSALKGIILTIFSSKILTLITVFFLDVL